MSEKMFNQTRGGKRRIQRRSQKKNRPRFIQGGWLVSWCFEPSQPLGVTSGLNTNSDLFLSYSAHESPNIDHNISTAQLFQIYTQITRISTKPHTFYIIVKIFLHVNFTSKYLTLYRT